MRSFLLTPPTSEVVNGDFAIRYAPVGLVLKLPTTTLNVGKSQDEKFKELADLTPVSTHHNIVDENVYVGNDN